ncbi:MAG: nitroreductase family protein [Thermotogaceae bacterium]|nr:nitroreductase family protein [Thermotogaceae bacterium]
MRKISFEKLVRLSEFEVDVRKVHEESSHIFLIDLKSGESFRLPRCDFQIHVAVLRGTAEVLFEEKKEKLNQGCLASVLPDVDTVINAVEDLRLLIIKDNPTWVLLERRSVRKFSSREVPREIIEKIFDVARFAPSAGNMQPWRVYITSKMDVKKLLYDASFKQEHILQAPWVAVITVVPDESAAKYEERGSHLYSIQDTASFTTYVMLAAKAYGLDSCWIGDFNEDRVWKIIGSPEGQRPVAIVVIGYGEEKPEPPYRKSLDRFLRFI